MKKLLFIVSAMLISNTLFAQTKFENISLKEAIAKAKIENKYVMVMTSTTWCGICKVLVKHVFSQKEVGDYMNKNLISLKYDIDVADPDSIGKMGVKAYPTFIFFNGDGEEVSRHCGANGDLVENVKKAIAPQNSWKAREERLRNEPEYAIDHALYLNSLSRSKEATELLNSYLKTKSIAENFSKEKLEKYEQLIFSVDSPIITSMLENKKEIVSLIGKEYYGEYLRRVVSGIIANRGRFHKAEKLDELVAFVKEHPDTKSGISMLVAAARDAIIAKDGVAVFSQAVKFCDKYEGDEKVIVNWMYLQYRKEDDKQDVYKKFLEKMVKCETDNKQLEVWKDLQNKLN